MGYKVDISVDCLHAYMAISYFFFFWQLVVTAVKNYFVALFGNSFTLFSLGFFFFLIIYTFIFKERKTRELMD